MEYIEENLRLSELVSVANGNKKYFDYFLNCLKEYGFHSLKSFVDADDIQAKTFLYQFLKGNFPTTINLYDGVFSPYSDQKARWLLLGWIFRDAPAQRLQPLIKTSKGKDSLEKKVHLINVIRNQCSQIFPEENSWEWLVIREVFIDRLEGSRRAKKGALFEVIVRDIIRKILKDNSLPLEVADSEIKLENETYDISIKGNKGTLLIPVKTRETMGGGHAHIFTRDIRESISRAIKSDYYVFPIIIAESWTGNLSDLAVDDYIYLQKNSNQIEEIKPLLKNELNSRLPVFKKLV